MRPSSCAALLFLFVTFPVACTGPTGVDEEPEPVVTTTPRPSPSPSLSPTTVSCRGLNVPSHREVNTSLDRESGLLDFSYYVAKLEQDRYVTIRYRDDPWCRRNPETLRLIQHVGAGKEILGCLELPDEPQPGMRRVELWFFDRFVENAMAPALVVTRDIATTEAIATATLRAWIEGPTEKESDVGAIPSAPADTELLGIDVEDRTAIVDLNDDFERTNLGTTYEGAILNHLAGMVTQFEPIDEALLKIEGEFQESYLGHGFMVDERHPLVRPGPKRYRVASIC